MVSVAIDGPAGAGKSTIAKRVSAELGFIYVDTGAMYRAVGAACLEKGVDIHDKEAVIALLPDISIDIVFRDGEQRVILNGRDVSEEIRMEKVSMTASVVSAIPQVRAFLLELQRNFARNYNVIMDGRDIGTVVLPNAEVKIFLTASAESRAERRTRQLEEKGVHADYDTVLRDIIERDHQDMNRETAPLKAADDACIIDTTELNLEQSVQKIIDTIKEKL